MDIKKSSTKCTKFHYFHLLSLKLSLQSPAVCKDFLAIHVPLSLHEDLKNRHFLPCFGKHSHLMVFVCVMSLHFLIFPHTPRTPLCSLCNNGFGLNIPACTVVIFVCLFGFLVVFFLRNHFKCVLFTLCTFILKTFILLTLKQDKGLHASF